MNNSLPLQEDRKLAVTYRVEAGCLGPDGKNHIDEFCRYSQSKLQSLESDYIALNVVHRKDKLLPEMHYEVLGKIISHQQAEKYLAAFGKNLDDFECHLSDKLATLIDQFMGH